MDKKISLAEMLKSEVIVDFINRDQVKIAEDSGAFAIITNAKKYIKP